MHFEWLGLRGTAPIILALPFVYAKIAQVTWNWHTMHWRRKYDHPSDFVDEVSWGMEETLRTEVRNEAQESPTFGKRFKWVELETFVRLEH